MPVIPINKIYLSVSNKEKTTTVFFLQKKKKKQRETTEVFLRLYRWQPETEHVVCRQPTVDTDNGAVKRKGRKRKENPKIKNNQWPAHFFSFILVFFFHKNRNYNYHRCCFTDPPVHSLVPSSETHLLQLARGSARPLRPTGSRCGRSASFSAATHAERMPAVVGNAAGAPLAASPTVARPSQHPAAPAPARAVPATSPTAHGRSKEKMAGRRNGETALWRLDPVAPGAGADPPPRAGRPPGCCQPPPGLGECPSRAQERHNAAASRKPSGRRVARRRGEAPQRTRRKAGQRGRGNTTTTGRCWPAPRTLGGTAAAPAATGATAAPPATPLFVFFFFPLFPVQLKRRSGSGPLRSLEQK